MYVCMYVCMYVFWAHFWVRTKKWCQKADFGQNGHMPHNTWHRTKMGTWRVSTKIVIFDT